jgi:predicted ATP-dependent serine protease
LLERGAELSMLVDCLEGVERSARGQVLLVRGEAGVGKTTLIRRFCEERGQSARILWALATRSSPRARSGRCSTSPRDPAASSGWSSSVARCRTSGRRISGP